MNEVDITVPLDEMMGSARTRLLVVSNRFPPDEDGGYERSCFNVMQELRRNDVDLLVLTRRGRVRDRGGWVRRCLSYRSSSDRSLVIRGARLDAADLTCVKSACTEFRPNLVYLWNPVGLSLAVIAWLTHRLPSMAYIADHWFADWLAGGRAPDGYAHQLLALCHESVTGVGAIDRRIWRAASRVVSVRHRSWVMCLPTLVEYDSEYMKKQSDQRGIVPAITRVVHHGIRFSSFPFRRSSFVANAPRFLFVGRVVPAKGPDTAIHALARVVRTYPAASLTLVGPVRSGYRRYLERAARSEGVIDRIRFLGAVESSALPALYHSHHVLLFPSAWDEPFGITLVEAMACGLPVMSTGTGGAAEAAPREEAAIWFRPGDGDDLARRAVELVADEERRAALAVRALAYAKSHFSLPVMASKVLGDIEVMRVLEQTPYVATA